MPATPDWNRIFRVSLNLIMVFKDNPQFIQGDVVFVLTSQEVFVLHLGSSEATTR